MGNCQETIKNNNEENLSKKSKGLIKIEASMLLKESFGLYDYETKEKIEKQFIKRNYGILYFDQTGLYFSKYPNHSPLNNYKHLLNFSKYINEYKISIAKDNINCENKLLWKVTNDIDINKQNNLNELHVGQLIKLGKTILMVRESNPISKNFSKLDYNFINYKEEKTVEINDYLDIKEHESISISYDELKCRFCFFNFNNDENPLINICKCTGSMKYTHFECLKEWMLHKTIESSSEFFNFYSYEKFVCELCHTNLSNFINYKGKKLNLTKYKEIDGKYLVLELYSKESGNNYYVAKGIYFINFNFKNYLVLGRGNDVDISLMDISVSRIHSKLMFLNNKFYIENLGSKFGTLLGPYKEIILKENKVEEIQVGNINLKLWSLFDKNPDLFCCCKEPINYDNEESNEDINLKTEDLIIFYEN